MSRWPRVQIRKLAKLGTGHTPSRSVEDYWVDCTIPWLTLADVGPLRAGTTQVVTETKECISALGLANSAAVHHPAGTVAMSRTASVGYSCILGVDMATSQDYVTWTCGPKLLNRYLLWVLRGERDLIIGRMMGSTHKTIYMPDIEELDVPVPPLEAQRSIADFLDAETARIDGLIAKKQRLLELLDDRLVVARQSAVLGDFNPLSGDGRLPAGWIQVQLGVLIELQRGHDLPADQRVEGPYPVVSSGGVSGWHHRFACPGPAVITGRYGTVGQVFYVDEDCWPLNTTLYVKDFRGNDPRWVALVLRCLPLDADSEKAAVGGINRNVIGKLRVPRPPLAEQREIVRSVAAVEESVATAVRSVRQQINLLAEHRQALITAAVTGQLRVSSDARRSAPEDVGLVAGPGSLRSSG